MQKVIKMCHDANIKCHFFILLNAIFMTNENESILMHIWDFMIMKKSFFFLFFQMKVKVSLNEMKNKVKCQSHPLVHLAIHLNFLFLCVRRIFCRLDRAIKIIFVLPFSLQFGYKTVTSMTCLRSANFLL